MAKRQRASSAPEKLVRVTGEDIIRHGEKPDTIERLKKLAAMPDAEIDYSDIPQWTEEQWARAMPFREWYEVRRKKEPVTVRIDKDVLAWLREEGDGYQTRMNKILREAMAAAAEKHSA